MYSQKYLTRSNPYEHHARAKMIGKGKFLNLLSNHNYLESAKYKYERLVQANEALLFHYRDGSETKTGITDKAALKYGAELHPKVDQICQIVFPDGVCPKK